MSILLMQRNPSVASYRNGLQMLHLYQDIFEGNGAIGSMAFHSASTFVGASQSDDVHSIDEEYNKDESMHRSCFSPSINTSSRSIDKGKSTRRGRRPTTQNELVDAVKELVVIHARDVPDASLPISSSMSVLDKYGQIL